jgi:hypothetical protein
VLTYYDQQLEDADIALQPTSVRSARATATDPGHARRLMALKWLTREREDLAAAVKQAVANSEIGLAWRIAGQLASFFEVRAHYEDWLDTHEFVLRHLNHPEHMFGRATVTRSLGKFFYFQHKWEEAVNNLREALRLFHSLDLEREVGITLLYLGDTYRYKRECCVGVWLTSAGQERQWMRDSRLQAYSAYLLACNNYNVSSRQLEASLQIGGGERQEQVSARDDTLRAIREVVTCQEAVLLLGTQPVQAACGNATKAVFVRNERASQLLAGKTVAADGGRALRDAVEAFRESVRSELASRRRRLRLKPRPGQRK